VITTEEDARRLALSHLENPQWEPVLTLVEDAGDVWRVSYDSRAYVETGSTSLAPAGNLPLLINKASGVIDSDLSYLPRWKSSDRVSPALTGKRRQGARRCIRVSASVAK